MSTELNQEFRAELSNTYNSIKVAYQGGTSTSPEGASAQSRTGYIDFSGLNTLAGKKITKIEWNLSYDNIGKQGKKVITFSSPAFSFTSGVVAYGNSETRTLTSGTPYNEIISAIKGSGFLRLTMYNGENKTTHNFNSTTGSYTENFASVEASSLKIYYEESSVFIYTNGEWKTAIPYVYSNGVWINTTPQIYSNNEWHS